MKQLIVFPLFLLLITPTSCSDMQKQQLKVSDFSFHSIFGTTSEKAANVYCLLGSGFFKAPSSKNSDQLITDWIAKHPEAVVVPVSAIREKNHDQIIYCWLIDGKDTLNNYLIRNGCFPGGTMMPPKTWEEMEKWEKDLYHKVDEKPDIKVMIDKKSYDRFLQQIGTAESYAKRKKLGIWSEKRNH